MDELRGPAAGKGYEPHDLSVRRVAQVVAALAVIAAVAVPLARWIGSAFRQREESAAAPITALEQQALNPPAPTLQTDPLGDLARLHARENRILGSYGWIDHGKGIAHIPIDRAMALEVGKSLDAPP